jgi:hypothetical protein
MDAAEALLDRMMARDPSNAEWSTVLRQEVLIGRARLALASGQASEGRGPVKQVIAEATREADRANRTSALIIAGDIEARLGQAEAARAYWTSGFESLSAAPGADDERFVLLKRLGRDAEARDVAAALDRRGYRHPAYLREKGL